MSEYALAVTNPYYLSTNWRHDFGLIPIFVGGKPIGIDTRETYDVIDVQKDSTTLRSQETGIEIKKASSFLIAKGYAPIMADGKPASGVRQVNCRQFCDALDIRYLGEGR